MSRRSKTVNTPREKPDRNTVNLSGIPKSTGAKKALQEARNRKITK